MKNSMIEKLTSRFFRKVDDAVWDMTTGKLALKQGDSVLTLEGADEKDAQVSENMFAALSVPVPAFAQQLPLEEQLELYAAENSALREAGFENAQDLFTSYQGLEKQLAAAQAREQQLRELIEHAPVSSGVCCCGDSMDSHQDPMVCGHSPVDQWDWAVFGLLKETPDTTALEAMIAKAGEVMRERCADSTPHILCDATIRALPCVTLEDLIAEAAIASVNEPR